MTAQIYICGMSGDDENTSDSLSGTPIDFDRLDAIRERFAAGDRFRRIDDQPVFAPDRLVCVYDQRFYPKQVRATRLEIVWFENGDFSLHTTKTTRAANSITVGTDTCPITTPVTMSIQGLTHRHPVTIHRIRQTGEMSSRWSFQRSKTDSVPSGRSRTSVAEFDDPNVSLFHPR